MSRPDDAGRIERFPVGAAVTLDQLESDPYPVLARLRREEPVSWVPAIGAWLVTRRDLAVEVMRDADRFTVDDPRFTTAAVLGPSMLSLDGGEHSRHRSPFAPSFRPGIVRDQFDGFLAAQVAELVAALADAEGPSELRTGLAGPLAVVTITRFLGLEGVQPSEVLSWYHAISDAIVGLTRGVAVGDDGRAAVAEINARVEQTLTRGVGESLVQEVARSGSLREDEMTSAIAVLMFGAIETSEGMTANALWYLLTDPGLLDRVRADRSLIGPLVEESLRMEPAAAVIDRYTTGPVVLGGGEIPERELVTVSLLGSNRDPAVFPEPDRFDLDRENLNQHLAFVQGPHGCLGLHLARMETVAAIGGLLDAAPDLGFVAEGSEGPRGLIFRKPPAVLVDGLDREA